MERDVRRRWVRLAFLLVLVFQPLQFAFVRFVSEPYPALMMPAFGGTLAGSDGLYHARSVDVAVSFEDGSDAVIPPSRLFDTAPRAYMVTFLRSNFRETRHERRDEESALESFVKTRVLPIYAIRNRQWYDNYVDPATVAWLRGRMAEIFPDRTAVLVRFDWYDDAYVLADGRATRSRERIGDFPIAL